MWKTVQEQLSQLLPQSHSCNEDVENKARMKLAVYYIIESVSCFSLSDTDKVSPDLSVLKFHQWWAPTDVNCG